MKRGEEALRQEGVRGWATGLMKQARELKRAHRIPTGLIQAFLRLFSELKFDLHSEEGGRPL